MQLLYGCAGAAGKHAIIFVVCKMLSSCSYATCGTPDTIIYGGYKLKIQRIVYNQLTSFMLNGTVAKQYAVPGHDDFTALL